MLSVKRQRPGSIDDLERIESSLRSSTKWLDKLDLVSLTETNVVLQLLRSRKTVAELVEGLYQAPRGSPHYPAYYDKVRRAAHRLESKGYLTRGLLGRDKPYRLTRLAWDRIWATGMDSEPAPVVSRTDALLYAGTFALGAYSWLAAAGVWGGHFLAAYSVFLVCVGMSIIRFIEMVRRMT